MPYKIWIWDQKPLKAKNHPETLFIVSIVKANVLSCVPHVLSRHTRYSLALAVPTIHLP